MKEQIVASMAFLCLLSAGSHADIIESFGSGANQFSMTFVRIGNPGNAADTTGNPNPAGSVGYNYRMGKYEVSRDMINKANAEGNLGIMLHDMSFVNGGPRPAMPAAGMSWNEAARFVNWLNTSQGFQPAYKFDKQPGEAGYNPNSSILLWQFGDAGYDSENLFRNTHAKYFLPSVDEWYKAAYFDPNANGGTGVYWNFPAGSDTAPTAVGGGTSAGTAVYGQPTAQGPADITNAGGLSPYGVIGLGGNIWEWQESEGDLLNNNPPTFRWLRGGNWFNQGPDGMSVSSRYLDFPTSKGNLVGFRVASIPEPNSAALLMLATVGLWQRRMRTS